MTQIKASDISRTDLLLLDSLEFPVARVEIEDEMVKVSRDTWGRSTPIYFKPNQWVDVKRHPRFDLADDAALHWLKSDAMAFIDWLNGRGWKIVPK